MDLQTFLTHFDTIAQAPNGITKLRSLILDLAVRGKLVPQYEHEISAVQLIREISEQRKQLVKAGVIRSRKAESIDQDDEPYDLPTHWKWVRLCEVIHDLGQKKPDISFSYIDVSTIDKEKGSVSSDVCVINPEDAPSRARKLVKKGTVIYSTVRPYLLNIAVINQEYEPEPIVSTAFSVLHPFDRVSNWYIYYLLRSQYFVDYVERYQKGVAYPAISDTDLLQSPIPLPPFEEQIRIVEKVNELMALCDRYQSSQETRDNLRQKLRRSAIASLMNVETDEELQKSWSIVRDNWQTLSQKPEDVGDLRQAVLELAAQGKLVSQDPDESASEQVSKIQFEIQELIRKKQIKKIEFSEIDKVLLPIPKNWMLVRLGSILQGLRYGTSKKCDYGLPGTPVLRIPNINVNEGRIAPEDLKFTELSDSELQELRLLEDDLLMIRSNGSTSLVGRVAVISSNESGFAYAGYLVRLRSFPKYLYSKYLCLALSTFSVRQQIEVPIRTTSGVKNINSTEIANLLILLPPLAEQKRIVVKVDELMQMCDRLEESLRQSQQQVEALAASAISHLTI